MRKAMVAALLSSALTITAQAAAATTQFTALAKGEFEGASAFTPCPTDPTITCEVGHIAGYGAVTQVFTFRSGRPVGDCFELTGTVLWTLVSDPRSTLSTREVIVDCTPGASGLQPAHSFGHPLHGQGSYEITGGTGVFAGASGTGTVYTRSGGDSIVIRYVGTLTLP